MTTSNPTTTRSRSDDPIAEVARRVDDLVLQGMSKLHAHAKVMKDDSDLRQRYVVAYNKKCGRPQRAAEYSAQLGG